VADTAVVCGATGGLGPAVVEAFVARGDRVIAVARSSDELGRLEASFSSCAAGRAGSVAGEVADMTRNESVEELWGRIDRTGTPRWLVNVTGGFRGGNLVDSEPEDFNYMIGLNLASAWWSCRAAARRMAATPRPGGCIVNLASRSALLAEGGAAAYAVSKAGVIKLTQVMAEELKGTGVRVNCVLPALIDTPSNRRSIPEKVMQHAVPPGDIASVIAFLCSDAAATITGASVPVYGRS
jgi:NAD(P)-dependent dehydrogenase (short-subunit alcohol dehydrogenase family)